MADEATRAAIAAAVTAALTAAGLGPTAPPAATTFALTPASVNQNVINMSTTHGAKLYKAATEPLKTTFSLDKPNVRVLLEELHIRASASGWDNIFLINIAETGEPANVKDLLTQHGQIPISKIQIATRAYLNQEVRDRQSNYQLYICLTATVDTETTKTMSNDKSAFIVTPTGGTPTNCGVSYLKTLLSKAKVDTRATTSHIRTSLGKLRDYIDDPYKQNIKALNEYVREQMTLLSNRGETSTDILIHLFTGYEECTDKEFKDYIKRIKDEYNEGRIELDYKQLMDKAEVKYKSLVQDGKWNAPSEEQEQIVALQAQIATLKKPKAAPKDNKSNKGKKGKDKGDSKGKKKDKDGKTIEVKTPAGKTKTFKGKWAWRGIKPKSGESNTKEFDGKTWHFCTHHGYWVMHKSTDCELGDKKNDKITAAMAQLGIEDIQEE